MKKIFLTFILISLTSLNNLFSQIIYDFNSKVNLKDWYIVNDDVMGGVSFSQLEFDNNGNIIFNGQISLDNNGGFASMRCDLSVFNLSRKKVINLRVKGDKKTYQLRIKKNRYDYHSYVYSFSTSGTWELISINLSDMYPSFRGRRINDDNYIGRNIQQLSILISNNVEENFSLKIDKIFLSN